MANHSSILSWRIPRTEEPGRLYSPWGWTGLSDSHFHMTTFTKAIIDLFVRTGLLRIQTQSLSVWPLAQVNFSTGIPPFSKVILQYNTTKFTVTKDLHQYLLLLTEKNLEFFILWWKGKILSNVCFAATITQVTCTLSSKSDTTRLLLWELHSTSTAIALTCACGHMRFISVYLGNLLARCVLR